MWEIGGFYIWELAGGDDEMLTFNALQPTNALGNGR